MSHAMRYLEDPEINPDYERPWARRGELAEIWYQVLYDQTLPSELRIALLEAIRDLHLEA